MPTPPGYDGGIDAASYGSARGTGPSGGPGRRAGTLIYNKKPRWCVLTDGRFAIYSSKADSLTAPTLDIGLRADVSCVMSSNGQCFRIALRASSQLAKGSVAMLAFSSHDPQETQMWAKELTDAWKNANGLA